MAQNADLALAARITELEADLAACQSQLVGESQAAFDHVRDRAFACMRDAMLDTGQPTELVTAFLESAEKLYGSDYDPFAYAREEEQAKFAGVLGRLSRERDEAYAALAEAARQYLRKNDEEVRRLLLHSQACKRAAQFLRDIEAVDGLRDRMVEGAVVTATEQQCEALERRTPAGMQFVRHPDESEKYWARYVLEG